MQTPFLHVQLTTKFGNKPLNDLVVNEHVVSEEVGLGRALYIGNCKESRIINYVCNVTKNSHGFHTVIATHSYDFSEEVTEKLRQLGIKAASPKQKTRTFSYTESRVYVSVLEQLYLAKDWHVKGFKPSIIHVLDPKGITLRYSMDFHGEQRCRASNIALFKSVYEAHKITPYIIYWTTECCGCVEFLELCKCFGVEGVQYGNGKAVRTAGLLSSD
jgi:hypothetical protein